MNRKRTATFNVTDRTNVPTGRHGKHTSIVNQILDDLKELETGKAIKIPLSELPDTKVKIRSALNRATRKLDKQVATATDDDFLYVWNS
jgi:hypothetical protein